MGVGSSQRAGADRGAGRWRRSGGEARRAAAAARPEGAGEARPGTSVAKPSATRMARIIRGSRCQAPYKFPHLGSLKIPDPRVHCEASAGRTRPALSILAPARSTFWKPVDQLRRLVCPNRERRPMTVSSSVPAVRGHSGKDCARRCDSERLRLCVSDHCRMWRRYCCTRRISGSAVFSWRGHVVDGRKPGR